MCWWTAEPCLGHGFQPAFGRHEAAVKLFQCSTSVYLGVPYGSVYPRPKRGTSVDFSKHYAAVDGLERPLWWGDAVNQTRGRSRWNQTAAVAYKLHAAARGGRSVAVGFGEG